MCGHFHLHFEIGKRLLAVSAYMIVFCLPSPAQNLGKQSLPKIFDAAIVKNDNTCLGSLLRRLWSEFDWDNLSDGNADTDKLRMNPDIGLDCNSAQARVQSPRSQAESLPILIHGAIWLKKNGDAFYSVVFSDWQVYRYAKTKDSVEWKEKPAFSLHQEGTSNGKPVFWTRTPPLYGAKRVRLVGVNCFLKLGSNNKIVDPGNDLNNISLTYKVNTKQLVAENVNNFNTVLGRVLGGGTLMNAPNAPGLNEKAKTCSTALIAVGTISGAKPPFDMNITVTAKLSNPDTPKPDAPKRHNPAPDPGSLESEEPHAVLHYPVARWNSEATSKTLDQIIFPASLLRVGTVEKYFPSSSAADLEPNAQVGGNEKKAGNDSTGQSSQDCSRLSAGAPCSFSQTIRSVDKEYWDIGLGLPIPGVREPRYNPSNPALPPGSTRNANVYGFVDIFPFAAIASKTSYVPHFAVGIPVVGKVFYRPFFGLSQNITGWNRNFPFQMNFLAGVVYLNQEIAVPNPVGRGLVIQHARVIKPMFGVELPVGNLLSKVTSLGGSKSQTGGKQQ